MLADPRKQEKTMSQTETQQMILDRLHISRATLYRWRRDRSFPPPAVNLGRTLQRWLPEEVDAWVAGQSIPTPEA